MKRFLLLLTIASCSSQQAGRDLSNLSREQISFANDFDHYIHGKLSAGDLQSALKRCEQNPLENPFCPSYLRLTELNRRIEARLSPGKPVDVQKPKEVSIIVEKGKVKNWKELRNIPVKVLVRSLSKLNPADFAVVQKKAIQFPYCNNPVAIAVASTLEDLLPNAIKIGTLIQLYEKGVRCLKWKDPELENYRTRMGLLSWVNGRFKEAKYHFERAAKVPNTQSARPHYWLFRSWDKLRVPGKAALAVEKLQKEFPLSFHSILASEATRKPTGRTTLERKLDLNAVQRSKKVLNLNALVQQAEILKQLGYDESAALIADWAVSESWKAEGAIRNYLANLGDAALKIAIANDLLMSTHSIDRGLLELYFPKAFEEAFQRGSGAVDPFFLYAVARQESSMNEKAVSPANAQGLLQILPETAKRFVGNANLFDPRENINVAQSYFQKLFQHFPGGLHLSIGAYNAGEDKVEEWMRRYPITDPILFIDLISFRETRNYVGYVLRNYYWYRKLYSTTPESVTILPGAPLRTSLNRGDYYTRSRFGSRIGTELNTASRTP